jgi:hypothetical protein
LEEVVVDVTTLTDASEPTKGSTHWLNLVTPLALALDMHPRPPVGSENDKPEAGPCGTNLACHVAD